MPASNVVPKGSDALVFNMSSSRRWHARVIAGLLGFIGAGSLFFGKDYIPDYLSVGFVCFGLSLFILYFSQSVKKQGAALIIDNKGLWFCDWELPVIPWRYIRDVYSSGTRFRPLLYIELQDEKMFFGSLDREIQRKINRNPLIKTQHLVIPTNLLQTPVLEMVEKIRYMRKKMDSSSK